MYNPDKYKWWGPPRDFRERRHDRKVSWLELFYDLVYVAAIAQITHHLAMHPSWNVAGYSFVLFAMVFWSWVNGSQYYDLHGHGGIRTRLMTFWQMLAVAAIAITIDDAYSGHHQALAVTFVIIQLFITYLWWSVGIYDPSHRRYSIFYTTNYLIAFVLLFVSVFTSSTVATLLWIVVLLFNLTPGLTAARAIITGWRAEGQVYSATASIIERFGLFTIIVLAESILGTVTSIADIPEKTTVVWVAFILCILITYLLWSVYFDMTGQRDTKKGYWYMQLLIYLHLPLLAAFCVIGACFNVLLSQISADLQPQVAWLFCIALSVILFAIVGLTQIIDESEEDRSYLRPVKRLLVMMGFGVLLIPFLTGIITALNFICIIAVVLFIPVFVAIRSWVRHTFFGEERRAEDTQIHG